MGLKSFAQTTLARGQKRSAEDIELAKQTLVRLLGDDISLIKDITYNQRLGKFHSIEAPETVIKKLRDAGLLKD